MTEHPSCWCGNADLVAFDPGYWRCAVCETLVSAQMPGTEITRVTDEPGDLYGREYYEAIGSALRDTGGRDEPLRAVIDLRWMRPGVAGGIENLSRSFMNRLL